MNTCDRCNGEGKVRTQREVALVALRALQAPGQVAGKVLAAMAIAPVTMLAWVGFVRLCYAAAGISYLESSRYHDAEPSTIFCNLVVLGAIAGLAASCAALLRMFTTAFD